MFLQATPPSLYHATSTRKEKLGIFLRTIKNVSSTQKKTPNTPCLSSIQHSIKKTMSNLREDRRHEEETLGKT